MEEEYDEIHHITSLSTSSNMVSSSLIDEVMTRNEIDKYNQSEGDEDEDENNYSESFEDESIHEENSNLDIIIADQHHLDSQFKSPKIYHNPANQNMNFSDIDESSTDDIFTRKRFEENNLSRVSQRLSSGTSSPDSQTRVSRFQYSDQDEDEGEEISSQHLSFYSPKNLGITTQTAVFTDPSISASLSGGSESSTPSHSRNADDMSNISQINDLSHSQPVFFSENWMPRPHTTSTATTVSSRLPPNSKFPLSPFRQDTASVETSDYYSPYSSSVQQISPKYWAVSDQSDSPPSPRSFEKPSPLLTSPVEISPLTTIIQQNPEELCLEPSWPWTQYQTEEGWTYYYNELTGESSWDYPDQHTLHGEQIEDVDNSSPSKQVGADVSPSPQNSNPYNISEDSDLSSCTSLDAKTETNSVYSRSVSQSGMIEQKNKQGQSALHISALGANVDALRLLLSTGIDPNILDGNGCTAMHIVCGLIPSKDQVLCIQSLISYHANANIQDPLGNTAIHILLSSTSSHSLSKDNIQEYQLKSLEAILHSTVDLSIVNDDGEQPLHIATRLGLLGCMQLLLKYTSSTLHDSPKKPMDDDSLKSKESSSKLLRKGSSRSNKSNPDQISKNVPTLNGKKTFNYVDLSPMESMGDIVHYYSSSDESRRLKNRASRSQHSDEKRKKKEQRTSDNLKSSNSSPTSRTAGTEEMIPRIHNERNLPDDIHENLEVTISEIVSPESIDYQSLGQLRDGWVEYCTEEGDKYYYDSKTGLVQWKHPFQDELDKRRQFEPPLNPSLPTQNSESTPKIVLYPEKTSYSPNVSENNVQAKLRKKHTQGDHLHDISSTSRSSGMKTMTIEAEPPEIAKTLAHHGSMRTISLTTDLREPNKNKEKGTAYSNEISNPISTFITPPGKEKRSSELIQTSVTPVPFPVSRIPSVSSISGESDTSKESKRHLEVWNRFFENAMLVNQAREDSDAGSKFHRRKGVSVGGFTPSFVRKKVSISGKDDWNLPPPSAEYEELISRALTLTDSQQRAPISAEKVAEAGNWALLAAVMRGDVATTNELLLRGINPSCIDDQIRTPLHHACHSGDVRMISLLNDYGCDLDSLDSKGQSPLHIACDYNHTEAVQCLLQCGANTDLVDNQGNSPLHLVAHNGNIESCQILLEYGAHIEIKNSKGQIPLEVARAALTTSQGSRPSLGVRKIIAALTVAQPDINATLFSHENVNDEEGHVTSNQILINSTVDEEYSLPSESVYEEEYQETTPKPIIYQKDFHQVSQARPIRSDSISSLSVNSDASNDDSLKKQKRLRNTQRNSQLNTAEAKRNEWIKRGKESNQHSQGIALPTPNFSKTSMHTRGPLLDHSHPAAHLTIQTDPPSNSGQYETHTSNSAYNYYDQPVNVLIAPQIVKLGPTSRDDQPEKIPPLTGSKVVSNVMWGAVSLLDATWKMFSANTSSSEETSPTEKETSWNSTAPPTDQELLRRGLGFHFDPHVVPASPKPPAIVLEDLKAHTEAYKNSNTPRGSFLPPPDEVVVAVEMARAAERHRRTPSRPTSTSGSPPKLSTYPKPPIEIKNNRNGYSMGSSLPKGVSWRYVDVLNQEDRSPPR